jgi:hypothetical protein
LLTYVSAVPWLMYGRVTALQIGIFSQFSIAFPSPFLALLTVLLYNQSQRELQISQVLNIFAIAALRFSSVYT